MKDEADDVDDEVIEELEKLGVKLLELEITR